MFAAYPRLTIVHRAGGIHSNIDPLSQLIRIPPRNPPLSDDNTPIEQDKVKCNIAQKAEDHIFRAAALKAAFSTFWWEDATDKHASPIRTRQQLAAEPKCEPPKTDSKETDSVSPDTTKEQGDVLPFLNADHWTVPLADQTP